MADYSESTKHSIGDLVLKIHDLETKLTELKSSGAQFVIPLRTIADLLDPNERNPLGLIAATDSHFATTGAAIRTGHRIIIGGEDYPALPYPRNLKELLQEMFETQQELRNHERLLDHAKKRARKI